jgi:hypothetical protein
MCHDNSVLMSMRCFTLICGVHYATNMSSIHLSFNRLEGVCVFVIAYANDPIQVIMDDSTMIRAAYITLDDRV